MGRRATPEGRISPAEARDLTELARGGTQAEVAARLHLSHTTVRHNLRTARLRTGATTNVHLLAIAVAAGDVVLDAPAAFQ